MVEQRYANGHKTVAAYFLGRKMGKIILQKNTLQWPLIQIHIQSPMGVVTDHLFVAGSDKTITKVFETLQAVPVEKACCCSPRLEIMENTVNSRKSCCFEQFAFLLKAPCADD